jgi:hypothetical protein
VGWLINSSSDQLTSLIILPTFMNIIGRRLAEIPLFYLSGTFYDKEQKNLNLFTQKFPIFLKKTFLFYQTQPFLDQKLILSFRYNKLMIWGLLGDRR